MKFSITLLFLLTLTSAASADLWCADLLGNYFFTPHRGTKMNTFSHPVYKLGEGEFGTVYRTINPDRSTFAFKEYKEGFDDFVAIDAQNLRLLDKIDSSDLVIQTVLIFRNKDSRSYLEDVLGRNLGDILKAPLSEISIDLKEHLFQRYEAYVKKVYDYLSEHFNPGKIKLAYLQTEAISGRPLPILKLLDWKSHTFITIKPENIIVDATTLEMTVVDPN